METSGGRELICEKFYLEENNMKTLSRLFTLWYIKRGYTFGYDFTETFVYTDGVLKSPLGLPKSVFRTIGRVVSEGFEKGLRSEETLDQQFN